MAVACSHLVTLRFAVPTTATAPVPHFKLLAERMKQRKEADIRQKDREWAAEDKAKMAVVMGDMAKGGSQPELA